MGYHPLDLTGRVAVVIGGTSGLGMALTVALAEAGADVVPTARRQEMVDAAATEVEARGRRTLRVTSDIGSRASLDELLAQSLAAFGQVDILVNCAGAIRRVPTLDLTEAEWTRLIDTNLTGVFRSCQVFGRHMRERGYGRIINIASLNSFVGFLEVAAYAAGKSGVRGLTHALAVEWARDGVCVNAIAPGVFRTPLNASLLEGTARGQELIMRTPMRRTGQPEELGGAVVFLASQAASFVTGHTLVVDGGFLASGVNQ